MSVTGRVFGTLPASDLARARQFYSKNLGLEPSKETDQGLTYECADHTKILLFPSMGEASGTHTQASFEVEDLEAEVKRMKANGVKFEEYDYPDFKSVNSIVIDKDGTKGAWFKDSEGNLLAISDRLDI
ncbi:MAG TPA: glyoxalase [Micromonosporaceae bacterium]|nr:glyoxalase [Micromonosporaceae bacterium]HCU52616.1 glyoxalase [Micromonosporaceae bacterium]